MLIFAQILHLLVIGMLCRDFVFIRLCLQFKQVALMKRSVIEDYKNIINLNFRLSILKISGYTLTIKCTISHRFKYHNLNIKIIYNVVLSKAPNNAQASSYQHHQPSQQS